MLKEIDKFALKESNNFLRNSLERFINSYEPPIEYDEDHTYGKQVAIFKYKGDKWVLKRYQLETWDKTFQFVYENTLSTENALLTKLEAISKDAQSFIQDFERSKVEDDQDFSDYRIYQLCDWRWLEDEDGQILRKQVHNDKIVYSATLVKYAKVLKRMFNEE